MLEQRIIDLEIKFSHQDELVDQLNKIVTSQQLVLEKQQKDILELKLSLTNSQNQNGPGNLPHEIPPHY